MNKLKNDKNNSDSVLSYLQNLSGEFRTKSQDKKNLKLITPNDLVHITEIHFAKESQIVDVDFICGLNSIEGLFFFSIKIVNASKIKYLTELKVIWLNYVKLDNIDFFPDLHKLETIYLLDNGISDLSPLQQLINLQCLYCEKNKIMDISAMKNLKKINWLNFDNNEIEDIKPLSELTELVYLSLANNKIKDLTPLTNLKKIQGLNVLGNPLNKSEIEKFSPLARVCNSCSANAGNKNIRKK